MLLTLLFSVPCLADFTFSAHLSSLTPKSEIVQAFATLLGFTPSEPRIQYSQYLHALLTVVGAVNLSLPTLR